MKTNHPFSRILLGLVALSVLALAAPRTASAAMSTEVFYDALDPYGDWIKTDEYGYAFQPRDVGNDWRPYTDGNWAYTDAGWTWVSEEPFGWATYHYGRWADLESTGWVWVPDTEWAPAWVSWRRSEKYVGWSPLPPEARFTHETGFHGWVDSHYDIGPTNYSFVQVRDLGAPRLRTVIVQPRENITIIRETRNITNVTYVNNVIVNNGPEYDVVSRQSSQPIRRLRLERSTEFNDASSFRDGRARTTVSGNSLRIVAPVLIVAPAALAPKKVARTVTNVQVNRGWKNAGSAEQVQQVRATIAAEPKAPANVPAPPKIRAATARTEAAPAGAATKTETAPPAAATAARTAAPDAALPAATPSPKKPGKPGKTGKAAAIAADPNAPPAPVAATDSPATPAPKAGGPRPKGRPGKPGAASENAPAVSTNPAPEDRPPTPAEPRRKIAPGAPIPPGEGSGPAPRMKRGANAPDGAPGVPPTPERKAPRVLPAEGAPSAPDDARPPKGAKMKEPKGARPEAAVPSPDRGPSEARSPESAGRERPQGRGPAADRPAPPAANRSPENRPPGTVNPAPKKPGKGGPADEDDKKKKGDGVPQ